MKPNAASIVVAIILVLEVPDTRAQAQAGMADSYRQAAQMWRTKAAQDPANAACANAKASYYDCVAASLGPHGHSCGSEPSCDPNAVHSSNHGGGGSIGAGAAGTGPYSNILNGSSTPDRVEEEQPAPDENLGEAARMQNWRNSDEMRRAAASQRAQQQLNDILNQLCGGSASAHCSLGGAPDGNAEEAGSGEQNLGGGGPAAPPGLTVISPLDGSQIPLEIDFNQRPPDRQLLQDVAEAIQSTDPAVPEPGTVLGLALQGSGTASPPGATTPPTSAQSQPNTPSSDSPNSNTVSVTPRDGLTVADGVLGWAKPELKDQVLKLTGTEEVAAQFERANSFVEDVKGVLDPHGSYSSITNLAARGPMSEQSRTDIKNVGATVDSADQLDRALRGEEVNDASLEYQAVKNVMPERIQKWMDTDQALNRSIRSKIEFGKAVLNVAGDLSSQAAAAVRQHISELIGAGQ